MKYYILFGPPGAGKGTHAGAVAQKYNLKHISTGELLRAEIAAGTELGRQAKTLIDAGSLVPDSVVEGHANTFIFPDINAGNIGYKIAQRMGNFQAYGPILLGLNSPITDLSRGCTAAEVYSMAIITAALA